MNNQKIALGVFVSLLSIVVLAGCDSEKKVNYDEVAKCLTEKGAKLYGAYWCPHCAEQKAEFGDSIKYVTYVECDPNGENSKYQECIDKKVEAYPTWVIPGFDNMTGKRSIEELAKKTGCDDKLPSSSTQSVGGTQAASVTQAKGSQVESGVPAVSLTQSTSNDGGSDGSGKTSQVK